MKNSFIIILLFILSSGLAENYTVKELNKYELRYDEQKDRLIYAKRRFFDERSIKYFNLVDGGKIQFEKGEDFFLFGNGQYIGDSLPPTQKLSESYDMLQIYGDVESVLPSNVKLVADSKIASNYEYSTLTDLSRRNLDGRFLLQGAGVLVIIFVALMRFLFPSVLSDYIDVSSYFNLGDKSSESEFFTSESNLIITLFVALLLSFNFIYLTNDGAFDVVFYMIFVGIIIGVVLLKRILAYLGGKIFDLKNWNRVYSYELPRLLFFLGLAMFISIAFGGDNRNAFVLIVSILLSLFWIIKLYKRLQQSGALSLLGIVSYLCAAEILVMSLVFVLVHDFLRGYNV